ncbi:MAG: M1 family aminopeptidase [Erythrobacter sp.]
MLSAAIAGFELRYQLKNPVFWASAAIFLLIGFGLSASANVSIGGASGVHENAPFTITFAMAILGLFYLFVITSFVANAVVRDDVTKFGPMIRATPVGRGSFLAGRFAGGFAIALIGFLALPLGIALGSAMPWVDPETVGPGGFGAYAWPFLIIAVPNILMSSAVLFSLATITRSMLASYIGVLVLVMGYLTVATVLSAEPEYQSIMARFEPMGVSAIAEVTRYWTQAEMNTRAIPLEGDILINRAVTLGIAAVFLMASWAGFSLTERAPSPRQLRRLAQQAAAASAAAAGARAASGKRLEARPAFGAGHVWASFILRLKMEVLQVLKSPGLVVLLLLGLAFCAINLAFAETLYGTPSYPLTADVITTVMSQGFLFSLIVAVFYGGELVWRERDVKIGEILDATPVPGWVMFVPKILAIFAVLLLLSLAGMLTGVLYQLIKATGTIDLGLYLAAYVFPQSVDLLLIAVLAVFFQVLSPNKYVGWGLVLVWFVGRIFLSNLGYTNMLYMFGSTPSQPLSDMNGTGGFWQGGLWARAYWGAFGVLLLCLAHWLWPRGTVLAVLPRIKAAPARITRTSGAVALASVGAMIGTGSVIHHNIKVLNTYETSDETEARMAEYERRFLQYETLPRPVVTDVAFDVALYPEERRMEVRGHYLLRNDTAMPIREVHVRQGDNAATFTRLDLAGASLAAHDKRHQYRIYRFAEPLTPGATTRLDFASRVHRRGFANGDAATDIVGNGTFVNNFAFAPIIGMDRRGMLQDRTERRRQGLPAELRTARLEDTSAQANNYIRADWVNARVTISTSADQVPVAPGNKVSDIIKNGRRIAVFESPAPILNFFSVQSARYKVAEKRAGKVLLEVYHDPRHAWNVPAMLKAMETSLGYFTRNFGPYQFGYARIIEFPGYESFAQAFAGTMPYSESLGFAADVRDPDTIDYVSYVTAHEFGHQYWAHQVVGADMQGSTLLSETLAQYAALMVMKHLYGEDKIRRFLKYELDQYLAGRKGDVLDEQPLLRVENQGHIHYRKGSLAMYLLQQRLGEDAVNRALARLIEGYKFKSAPFPRSLDLVAELRKEAKTPEQQALITDLFETITLYDLKAKSAKATRNADGTWTTRITIEAAKFIADGKGEETPARLAENIEVGLFTARPGQGAFGRANVLSMERRPLRDGSQVIAVVSKAKPAFAGVDPYNYYIDRNSDDNLVAVD